MISFFQKEGFRFFFETTESEVPAHVFVVGQGGQMLIWLDPISPALAHNMPLADQRAAIRLVRDHHEMLMSKWFEWFESFSRCA